jgi:hypothetical protein
LSQTQQCRSWLLALALLLGAWSLAWPTQVDGAASKKNAVSAESRNGASSTIPFLLDTQRVLLDVTFEQSDGARRKALAWFNMGMAAPVLSKRLYRELAIDRGQPLRMRIGDTAVGVASNTVVDGDGGIGVPSFAHLFAPHAVEAMLPVGVLQQFVVILDYKRRTLTLARPGAQKIDGVAVPAAINPDTGLITVAASIGGDTYPLVVDAGTGYSWMRGDVVARWLASHPEWRRAQGAVGQSNANMVDYAFEKDGVVARIPEISLGAVRLRDVGLLGTAPILGRFADSLIADLFWDNWRKSATGPVVGWLGGNALKNFKLTIDYPNRTIYWQKQSEADRHDLDQVGLTLVRRSDRYFIGGIVRKANPGGADNSTVQGVEVGDELIAVNGVEVPGAAKDAVLSALHGRPGEQRTLVIEHGGVRRAIDVFVTPFD